MIFICGTGTSLYQICVFGLASGSQVNTTLIRVDVWVSMSAIWCEHWAVTLSTPKAQHMFPHRKLVLLFQCIGICVFVCPANAIWLPGEALATCLLKPRMPPHMDPELDFMFKPLRVIIYVLSTGQAWGASLGYIQLHDTSYTISPDDDFPC